MMSANITAASTPWRRTGCSVTSAQSSGVPATSKKRVALADRAVLGERAARLAHEPHRRPLDRLAPCGAHEKRRSHAREGSPRPRDRRAATYTPAPWSRSLRSGVGRRSRRQRAGARTTARVVLENAGARDLALARRGRPAGLVPLARHRSGTRSSGTALRTPFPHPVAPGETVELDSRSTRRAPRAATCCASTSSRSTGSGSRRSASPPHDLEVDVAPLIAERRLAVVVHGGPDPRTDAALAAQEEPVVDGAPDGDGAPRRGRRARAGLVAARCSTRTPRAGRRSARRSSRSAAGSSAARASQRYGAWAARRPKPAVRRAAPPAVAPRRARAGRAPRAAGLRRATGSSRGAAVVRLPRRSGRRPT